jgi:hypothetical protein
MFGYPEDKVWVRYTWTTSGLEHDPPSVPTGISFRDALPEERADVTEIAIAAEASDLVWREMMPGIRQRMTIRIALTPGRAGSCYVVALSARDELVGVLASPQST